MWLYATPRVTYLSPGLGGSHRPSPAGPGRNRTDRLPRSTTTTMVHHGKSLTNAFEEAPSRYHPGLGGVGGEKRACVKRMTTDIATEGGQFDVMTICNL